MMSRAGQVRLIVLLMACLGAIPVVSGIFFIAFGLTLDPTGCSASPPFWDSEYRILAVMWVASGACLWWSLRSLAARALVTRALLCTYAVGGLARLLSVGLAGVPQSYFLAVFSTFEVDASTRLSRVTGIDST